MSPIEQYTPGHSENALSLMARRTLDSHGAFLRPHLRAGLRVLDIGCGPGSITAGIAAAVAPGEVVGIDREPSQLELARSTARDHRLDNVTFEQASVYELPFPDDSFDLAFAHALFEHIRAPEEALVEIRRVLRPGSLVALRSPDWGGFVVGPASGRLDAAIAAYRDLQVRNGGDIYVGRKFGPLLRIAGFRELALTATYEIYPDATLIGEYLAQQLAAAAENEAATALRAWALDPDAIFAQAWFEAVATR